MANDDPAPCFIVMGIVMIVFDIMIIESEYLVYIGGFFVFLGIVSAIVTENQKQKTLRTSPVQSQPTQQEVQKPPQNIIAPPPALEFVPEPVPESHKFCPYCGKNTNLKVCPDCGKEID